jgi:hypothetical protein
MLARADLEPSPRDDGVCEVRIICFRQILRDILKSSARSTQQIRCRPTAPQAPRNRIRANADNRKASRPSLFELPPKAVTPREWATVLLINMYRTSVSGELRRNGFWFRGLWRKPGQRFAVCGENPASTDTGGIFCTSLGTYTAAYV